LGREAFAPLALSKWMFSRSTPQQGVDLVVGVLVRGGDQGVADQHVSERI
jgi:hypothetical protein